MKISVAEYNPLSISRTSRLEHIIHELKADIICISGSGQKQDKRRQSYTNWLEAGYRVISWGWDGNAKYSNKSAGVMILLGPRLSAANIVEVMSPDFELQGRCGGLRCKSKSIDISIVVGYPPPITGKGDERAHQAAASLHTAAWCIGKVNTAKMRSLPLLVGDMQCKWGLTSNGERWSGHGEHWLQFMGKDEVDKKWEDFFLGNKILAMLGLFFGNQDLRISTTKAQERPLIA